MQKFNFFDHVESNCTVKRNRGNITIRTFSFKEDSLGPRIWEGIYLDFGDTIFFSIYRDARTKMIGAVLENYSDLENKTTSIEIGNYWKKWPDEKAVKRLCYKYRMTLQRINELRYITKIID